MECPICGEQVPLNAEACPLCGNPAEQFFLTEEAESSIARQQALELPYIPRRAFALEPLFSRRTLIIAGFTGAAIIAGVVVLLSFLYGGKSPGSTPEQPIRLYYDALSGKSLDDMLSLFAVKYQPKVLERTGVGDALANDNYSVSGLVTRTLEKDDRKARVVLEAVRVTVMKPGGKVDLSLVADVIKPLQEQDPDLLIIVNVVKEAGAWKIADRPLDGWAPDNLWVVGHAEAP